MGLLGNSERSEKGILSRNGEENGREYFRLTNGGNVSNGGKCLPEVVINIPKTFREFGINLEPKNGNIHVMSVYGKLRSPMYSESKEVEWKCDEHYAKTEQLISLMQEDGYEIIDLKHSLKEEDISCRLFITYK